MSGTTHHQTGGLSIEHMFEVPRPAAWVSDQDSLTNGDVGGRQTLKRASPKGTRAECCGHSTGLLAQIQRGMQVRCTQFAGPFTRQPCSLGVCLGHSRRPVSIYAQCKPSRFPLTSAFLTLPLSSFGFFGLSSVCLLWGENVLY